MTRASWQWLSGRGLEGLWDRLTAVFEPISILSMIILLWPTMISQIEAQPLPEAGAVDAQIARGVIERNQPSGKKDPFNKGIRAHIPDADRNCIKIGDQPKTNAQSRLNTALDQVSRSPIGAWLIQIAADRKVLICLDPATALEAHYRSHLRLLGLNAKLSAAGLVVFLAHELAHVPQHPRFSNNRQFSPDDMLLLQRVREAAAEAVATRILWQLRQQGMTAPWQEKLTTAYHDIAITFEATMADGQGTAHELWATRSAFHHWFAAGWRLEIYDELMLNTLARIANDPVGFIPTSRHLSDRFLRGIAFYAGESFLMGGDGRALIRQFRSQGISGRGQARLDAILAGDEQSPADALSKLAKETLSAVSPGPEPVEAN